MYERLNAAIPGHLTGFVRKVVDDLVREEIVLLYARTKHGEAYHLNIKKLHEIEKIVFDYKEK